MIHPDDRQLHEQAIRAPALRGKSFEANLRIIREPTTVRCDISMLVAVHCLTLMEP
ncbi:MAG: hypothetical protein IGR76_00890 [Synechococcales cyanobacterium T60_A2020_003]|nr:hypothetical protein [Synechococcales cyanobacterium T60_A2020_003]